MISSQEKESPRLRKKRLSIPVIALLCLCLLFGCAPTYSPYVFDQTASLKTQTLSLMNKATEPYSKHDKKVEELKADFESLWKQEQLRKNNQTKVKQWKLMLDDEGHLLYGYLHKWQQDTILNEPFIMLGSKLIGESFDLLQETEKERLK